MFKILINTMSNNSSRKYMLWLPLTAAFSVIIGLWAGVWLSNNDNDSAAIAKIRNVFSIIHNSYVDEVDFDSLVELSIPEMLSNLDPHSVYIPAEDRLAAKRDLEGSFYGIGIQFQIINDTLYVVEVVSGGASEEAGVQPGDRIIAVDGQNIAGVGVTNEEVFTKLRGPENTEVNITVKRTNSATPIEFNLIRRQVPVSPVDASYMLTDTIGYIRLGKFSDNAYEDLLSTLASLRRDGARAYVLDLRGNGGGYMGPAVLAANEFFDMPHHLIVSTKGRNLNDNRDLFSDGTGAFGTEPLAILIDEFTASSSEILAGAIQDNDRGLIIGRRSFGKGLVQTSFELPDSSEFRLTVQRYYTPSGRCIQKGYRHGDHTYELEVYDRYSTGEIFNADSIHVDSTNIYRTVGGRPVYGGGGIIPDIFIPSDTTGVTSYYIKVANAGLIRNFAYEYADLNRQSLNESNNTTELIAKLPSDYTLLKSFVNYANIKGKVAPRWYYINTSANLIVNQIKALIARDIIGIDSYYEIINQTDPVVTEAINRIIAGDAAIPVQIGAPQQ